MKNQYLAHRRLQVIELCGKVNLDRTWSIDTTEA
jgi:hypothetical protein